MAELDGCPGGEGRAAPPLRMVRFKLRFHPNPICASCWRPPCALLRLAPCSGLPGAWPARAGAAGTSSLILPFIPASVNTLPRALGPLRSKLHRSSSAGAGAALTPLVSKTLVKEKYYDGSVFCQIYIFFFKMPTAASWVSKWGNPGSMARIKCRE